MKDMKVPQQVSALAIENLKATRYIALDDILASQVMQPRRPKFQLLYQQLGVL